jgi:hypothetical protein
MKTAAARLATKNNTAAEICECGSLRRVAVGGTYEHNQRFCVGRITIRRRRAKQNTARPVGWLQKGCIRGRRASRHNYRFAHGIKHDFRGIVQV